MLLTSAIFESYRTLKDRTFHFIFGTNELSPEKVAEAHQALQQFGYLAFKIIPFVQEDLKIINSLEPDIEDNLKSPSQRLRAVLFLLWKKNPESYEDFNLYYQFKMEKLIEHYKQKLD
jgi:hypothetical protein